MVIPKQVKIGGMVYEVKIVEDLFKNANLYGEVIYSQQLIKIASDISDQRKVNAFLHEMYHAVLFESGKMGEQDESEVRRISNILTQIHFDNGWTFGKESEEKDNV
jgi:Zn-dependent peptidase ImmA (M78 family)